MKITLLVDSMPYITSNSYQHQLFQTLVREHTVVPVTLEDIRNGFDFPHLIGAQDRILSVLKLRTIYNNLDAIGKFLSGNPVWIYEQDAWEAFRDESPYKGAYELISNRLNVASFLNTSKWWSDFISNRGVRSRFVNMWMLPEYCTTVPRWRDRKISVGFCGQLHPHRQMFFEGLRDLGIEVTIVPQTSYAGYLSALSQMKVFVHSEEVKWTVDGQVLPANALWIKDVEAAARGCLAIRDFEPEMEYYTHGGRVTTVQGYRNIPDAADRIRAAFATDPDVIEARIGSAVEYIRQARGWKTIVDAMEEK